MDDAEAQRECMAVGIFAKAPIPGFAKTRLVPRLGAEGAAQFQAQLIRRAIAVARKSAIGPVSLWCAPGPEHLFFAEIAAEFSVTLKRQSEGDLGLRLADAFSVLTMHSPALIMGVDCVVFEKSHLHQCARLLHGGHDAVFVPVEDGGYIAAGLRSFRPEFFTGIPWNTPQVMAETRRRAASAGLRIAETAMLWDIDLPEDYDRAAERTGP